LDPADVERDFEDFPQASVHDLLQRAHRLQPTRLLRLANQEDWATIALSYMWFNVGQQSTLEASWNRLASIPPFAGGDSPAERLLMQHRLWIDGLRHRPDNYQGPGIFHQPPVVRRSGQASLPSATVSIPPLEDTRAPVATSAALGAAQMESEQIVSSGFYSSTLEEQMEH
jgi:hypothetical protein